MTTKVRLTFLPVFLYADPQYLKLLLAYEDRRFHSHRGVDPLALGRAALQLMTRGHIVSGGSTITMQLARLMEPRRERSVYAKLRQPDAGNLKRPLI